MEGAMQYCKLTGIVPFVATPLKGRFVVFSQYLSSISKPLGGALTLRGELPNPVGQSPNPT